MASIASHDSEHESFFVPFIKLAKTDNWRGGLNILYCNGNVLNFGSGMDVPVLISMDGSDDGIEDMLDLLHGSSEVDIDTNSGVIQNLFLTKILPLLSGFFIPNNTTQNALEQAEQNQSEITGILIQMALQMSDSIAINSFKSLREKRRVQLESTLDHDDYEDMIEGLQRHGIITAQLVISICSECGNHHLSLSPHPYVEESCSKCGEEWTSLTLFTFTHPYSIFKSNNSDLPIFISSFMRYLLKKQNSSLELEIYPNAKISTKTGLVEVDVYFPQYAIGLECKSYQDWSSAPTTDKLNGIAAKLLKQIQNYVLIGITHIGIFTNLPDDTVQKLDPIIRHQITEKNIPLDNMYIYGRDIHSLIGTLDAFAQNILSTSINTENK